ncbi:hypothetical protein J5I95_07810 [Candidatus Poribacteria bacterium]|nr:hypothetical protein [Candidatus Poribacteria bacterium]
MKTRLIYLFIFLFIFLLTPLAISGTWTDTRAINPFSVNGTTVSTSQHLPGMMGQAEYWVVTGYASISGTADPLGDDDIYEATIWLEASGKDAAGVPGRGNIDTSKDNDEYRTSTGAIRYATGTVASVSKFQLIPGTHQVKQLSDSVSHSYSKRSYSSPTDLSVSPYCYGSLSGDIGKASGGATLTTLTFRSTDNDADGDTPESADEILAAEICQRKQHCTKPFTATTATSTGGLCFHKRGERRDAPVTL